MRLSQQSKSLIQRAYRAPTRFERLLGKSGWDLEVLDLLGQSGEPAVVPHIVSALFSPRKEDVSSAAKAIETLLASIKPEDLVSLDEFMRGSYLLDSPYYTGWRRLEPAELAKWVGPGEPGNLLLRLSALHPNGYVREEAIRRLSLIRDGSELPYLLLRLNDWVAPIRKLAQETVLARIAPACIGSFIENLPLVVRLEQTQRGQHAKVLESVTQLLSTSDARPALIAGLDSPSKMVRRACFRFLTAGDPDALPELLLLALKGHDPVIRLHAARATGATLDARQLAEVLPNLSRDPFTAVRREALTLWMERFPDRACEALSAALLDPAASMRNAGQFYSPRLCNTDPAEFYRENLDTGPVARRTAALAGLAETGTPDDAAPVRPHIHHSAPRVRRAAVKALAKLGRDSYITDLLDKLLDDSPAVSSQAQKALEPSATLAGAGRLRSLLEAARTPHARKNLLLLIARLPKWESLPLLLTAATHEDPGIATLAAQLVNLWNAEYNRSYSAPTPDQIARIENALARSGATVDPHSVEQIRFSLKAFTKP